MNNNQDFKFTYTDFKNFIRFAKDIAPICSLKDWNHSIAIILRHDVDFDLKSAYKLAQIEKELEIRSSFFIMTTNQHYNPLSPTNSDFIRSIFNDGFEIGLHFDPSIYGDITFHELEKKMIFECSILESIIGYQIKSISIHNPARSGKYPIFYGYNNAYSNEIFSDECYMSDSCMDLRGKNPYTFILKAKDMPLQIVFHPMHWSENGQDYIGAFTRYLNQMRDDIETTFRLNRRYKKIMYNDSLSNRIKIWITKYERTKD